MAKDDQSLHLYELHRERDRLRAERGELTRDFASMVTERRAMADDLRRAAKVSRRGPHGRRQWG